MTTLPDALAACLRLMARGAPHPNDAALWHDTQRQASKLLAQHGQRIEDRRSRTRGAFAWVLIGVSLTAIALWIRG